MSTYQHKQLIAETKQTPGITVILFDDFVKRAGNEKMQDRIRYGERAKEEERERINKLLRRQ